MEIAINASFFTKRNVNINASHSSKLRLKQTQVNFQVFLKRANY